ncbi:TPA: type I pullulanase [bacterium]|nr:type I pullulanase [bacterium]
MSLFRALLNEKDKIEVRINKELYDGKSTNFYIRNSKDEINELSLINKKETEKELIYFFKINNINFKEEYTIFDNLNRDAILEYALIVKTKDFDDMFYYEKDDLGPSYFKEYTIFKVWAPTAFKVFVQLHFNDEIKTFEMIRQDKGVFEVRVDGDLDGIYYQYLVRVNGKYQNTIDPYAYSSSPNHELSCVIDLNKTNIELNKDKLDPFKNYVDAIIYELSIRDFSFDEYGNIKNRCKFLAFEEENTKTNKGYPTGISYLKELGITHLQLLPFYDFGSVDETNQFLKYNWGYDPVQYNVPEGSYSSDVYNPYSRVIECKKMISSLHQFNIRVIMDVVYNHVYDRNTSPFEKIVPYYYFKYFKDGTESNGSFCGNDFDSLMKMGSKFIVDSAKRWVKFYGVDGFRFDLMGIIDIETMNKVYQECKKIDPNIMIYGEGWDMPSAIEDKLKAAMKNEAKLEHIGFFNDRFREVVKGSTWHDELFKKGFASGDNSIVNSFINVMLGSCTKIGDTKLFSNPNKSINYVECHDNNTLWDKLSVSNKDESLEIRKKRQRLMLSIVLLSQGVPFIHAGQEFYRTKHGEHNSYKSSDEINKVDWNLMEDNYDSVLFFKDLINFRKNHPIFRLTNEKEIINRIKHELINDLVILTYNCEGIEENSRNIKVIINNSTSVKQLELDDTYTLIFNECGEIKTNIEIKNIYINPVSLIVLKK